MLNSTLTVLDFILGYIDLVSVFAGILVWEYFTKTKLSHDVKWNLYAGAFIALSFVNWRKASRKPEAVPDRKKVKSERIFVDEPELALERIAAMRLTDTLFTRTCDKWLTVSGSFEGIADSLAKDAIHLSLITERGQRINLIFSPQHRDRLTVLRQGQSLTAVAQIVPRFWGAVLGNAELLRVKPFLARVS